MTRPRIDDYAGLRVTVMGLGRFGGGVGVTRFLAERGAHVVVTDSLPPEDLEDSVAQLADLESRGVVSYRLGGHKVDDFTTPDLLVVNPAVKPGNRFVRVAEEADVPVTSEVRLLVKHLPNRLRTIGITGSAGKSTTTAMTAHILRKVSGQSGETPYGDWDDLTPSLREAKPPKMERKIPGAGVWMGGNIGGSLLPVVEWIRDDDWVVLELSSFMLQGLRKDEWSPHIAVVTNITPNHLDWHGSMESYVAAKSVIFDFQDVHKDQRVLGPDLAREQCARWTTGFGGKIWRPLMGAMLGRMAETIRLPGKHNAINGVLALCASSTGLGELKQSIGQLDDFCGLPHRLEYVGAFDGVKCYNDSKSTTPEAARLAIESFDAGEVRIVLGGHDKGSDFRTLAALAAQRCAGVYTIGATGDAIAELIPNAVRCGTLEVAVERAMEGAREGEAVVLSPGCASWDQFANYEERGERFVELVKAHGSSV
ncbi:MAG: UDP-N-acetylmuramoyl-L-alanine--D-glutamate ligase [Planctomycetota bacterium]